MGQPAAAASSRRASRLRRWLRDALILLLVLVGVHLYQTRATATGMAPPLAGIDVRGEAVELAQLRGQTVLVHFWATWCPVCRAEEDNIAAIARDWAVIGVALEDTSAAELRSYMDKAGLPFPSLRDADGAMASAYGAAAVPTSFVVDPGGRISYTVVGYTTEIGLRLRLWLAAKGW